VSRRLLLDSHAFLWAASAPEQLSPAVRALLETSETQLYVSAATIWELLVKARKQLIDFGGDPGARLQEYGAALQVIALPVSAAHLYRAFALEGLHKDPFDRLLIAQAQAEGLALVTRDRSVERYPVETIW
jgi:PIN domain nuclease of toxin-antitoxin system